MSDGYLRLWECPRILGGNNPDFKRCGFVARAKEGAEPGFCPYDHPDRVRLVLVTTSVHCADCLAPIPDDDCWTLDDRRVCGFCASNYIEGSADA